MIAPVLIRLPDVSALDGYTPFGMASEEKGDILRSLKRYDQALAACNKGLLKS